MQVNKPVNTVGRPNAAQLPQAPAPASTADPITSVPRVDNVQISDAGRALLREHVSGDAGAAQTRVDPDHDHDHDATGATDTDGNGTQVTSLDPSRAQDIRSKILSGAYLTLDAADKTARAILNSGDV